MSASTQAGAAVQPVIRTITQEMINRYADASGDHNPLHTDEEYAAGTQFGGTIAHGMLTLALLSEMMTGALGEAWVGGGRLKVRFRGAARPGDEVTCRGSLSAPGGDGARYSVECVNQDGEILVSGEAETRAS
jgi:3-hydroxybutyryl-CoA dehydratase